MRFHKKAILTLAAVGAIGSGAFGVVAAQSPGDDPPPPIVSQQRQGGPITIAADFLGLTQEELKQQLRDGATLAEIAEALGLQPNALIGHIVGAISARIGEAVANGDIDPERAAEIQSQLTDRITTLVFEGQQQRPGDGERPEGRRGPQVLSLAADFLGLTPEDLGQQLRDGATPAQVAEALGIDAQALVDYLVGAIADQINQAVADGNIDADKAAEIIAQLPQRIQTFVTEGSQRDGGGARPPGDRRGAPGHFLDVVADLLGIAPEAITAELQNGLSIADVAERHGSSGDAVVAVLLADVEARIAQAVADGRLTQDEADAKLAEAEEKITQRVFATRSGSGPNGGPDGTTV